MGAGGGSLAGERPGREGAFDSATLRLEGGGVRAGVLNAERGKSQRLLHKRAFPVGSVSAIDWHARVQVRILRTGPTSFLNSPAVSAGEAGEDSSAERTRLARSRSLG